MTRTAGPLCGRLRPISLKIDGSAIAGHITTAGTLHGQPFLRQPVPSLFSGGRGVAGGPACFASTGFSIPK
jgi:hypothetical protein